MGSCVSSSSCTLTATETRDFRDVFTLVRFLGDNDLRGDSGSAGSTDVPGGLKSCVGSTLSFTRVRRRVAALGVASSSAAFRGRPLRTVFFGAGSGVKSSSSCCSTGAWFSSPSESSSIMGALRRVAAARVDFRGDTVAIFGAGGLRKDRGALFSSDVGSRLGVLCCRCPSCK